MKEIYNRDYYEQYDVGLEDPVSYLDSQYTKGHLLGTATKIVEDLNPKTFLDVGCATGHLVAALRDLGVEAYGVDISEYAISQVREDIRPFCVAQSFLDPLPNTFPKKFDVVSNIEMIEHLYRDDAKQAVASLCNLSDHILFSSDPNDITEPTHFNVQLSEYWVNLFAENSFFANLLYHPIYVSNACIYFEKNTNFSQVAENYERNRRLLSRQIEELSTLNDKQDFKVELFFETEIDYELGHTENFFLKDNHIDIYASPPIETKSIRFDPVDGKACILRNVIIEDSLKKFSYTPVNGSFFDEFIIFLTDDPQISIPIDSTIVGNLHISADVAIIDSSIIPETLQRYALVEKEHLNKNEKLNNELGKLNRQLKINIELDSSNKKEKEQLNQRVHEYNLALSQKQQEIEIWADRYHSIYYSKFWKITKPFRWILDTFKKVLHKVSYCIKSICKKTPGVKNVYEYLYISKYFGKENAKFNKKVYGNYTGPTDMLVSPFVPSMDELRKQYNESRNSTLKFSIITPLYNTPENLLKEMILSVKKQSYPNWELCLADGGSNSNVQKIAEEFAKEDCRIRYKKLNENLGISGNSNAAIEMSTGDYIAILDHDDLLNPCALYENWKVIKETDAEFVYSDELTFEDEITNVISINYKSDFFIDTFLTSNYLCHFSIFSKKLFNQLDAGFQTEFNGSQDYDLFLRLLEKTDKVYHIPKILYFWRSHPGSVAKNIGEKNYAVDAAISALEAHFERENIKADVGLAPGLPSMYRIQYELMDKPLVSIIIPNKDEADTLSTCVNSILLKTTYKNYEIIICENNSETEEIFETYKKLEENPKIKIVTWENSFNYSSINNYAASFANGDQLLFLNNDTEIITANWIEEMLMFAQRQDVGAVGAKLYYPDNTIQHAGVVLGMGGVAGHLGLNAHRNDVGYAGNLKLSRDVTAVTAACLMIRKNVFDEIGGFDPGFAVAFNDVDLCLKIRSLGYLIVWTPYVELYHYESKTRGSDTEPDKINRFHNEVYLFQDRWSKELRNGDPAYNVNLPL